MSSAIDFLKQIITPSINEIILFILAISSLLLVLEFTGLLHPKLSKWINRNRLHETIRLLKELGIDVDTARRSNTVARLEQISEIDLEKRVKSRLACSKIGHLVNVGTDIKVPTSGYYDLMGATSDIEVAGMYAHDLAALWRLLIGVGGAVANDRIDFVVAPKAGAPLLASRFAQRLGKPLLLHNSVPKFRSTPLDPKSLFDFNELPPHGSRALMVDDSSTGGDKAVRLIDDLRNCGWQVSDFIVVFEPLLKQTTGQNAAARLKPKGVILHSIVKI